MATYVLIDKDNPNNSARVNEDPRRTEHVHAWFFHGDKCFNQCIVSSRYLLGEFILRKSGDSHAGQSKHRGRKANRESKQTSSMCHFV